jgi:nicotinamide riboside transporter PnuC
MNLEAISQVGITIFGITAVFLVAKKNKWGFVLGLISQPFWLMTSFLNKQWGIFILSIVYTFTWCFGIYEWFYKKEKK